MNVTEDNTVPDPSTGDGPVERAGKVPEAPESRGALSSRQRWLVVVAAVSVTLTGAGATAAMFMKSPAQAAMEAGPPPADVLTAPVERRVLKETLTLRGTVRAEQSVEVAPAATGGEGGSAPVVTKLPLDPGDRVRAGAVLMEVSGRPVLALPGKLPVYRDLKPGATGDDVAQLQQALAGLGHAVGGDPRGTFGAGTKQALTSLYASAGYEPLPALADGGTEVASAETAVTAAERVLEDAQDGVSASTAAKGGTGTGQRQVTRAREDLTTAREALAALKATDGPMLPAGEVVFLADFPARVDTVTAAVGAQLTGTALTLSAGSLVVEAELQEHQKGLVRKGQRVELLSEVSGRSATAEVASLSRRKTAGTSEAGAAEAVPEQAAVTGYALLIRPRKPLDAEFSGQDVRVTIEAASSDGEVLVVPVSAVTAGADERTTVTVRTPDGRRHRVEVTVSTTGDGFVEVRPRTENSLEEGDLVVTGVDSDPAVVK